MSEFPKPDERKYEMRYVPIGELKPAEYNPRKISNDELDKLALSIQQNGFIDPVIANKDKTIIGGHQRVKAAQRLGIQEVPVIFVDLDKQQEKVLNLALNRIGGSFDEELLTKIIQELPREMLDGTGFSQEEIEVALGKAIQEEEQEKAPRLMVNSGDVFLLGDHKIMCGDGTNHEHFQKLMGEEKPEVLLDLFSGSVFITSNKDGSNCRMMENDPGYVDVIIARWERLTGKKAVKIA